MPKPRGDPGASEQGSEYVRYAGLGVQFGASVVLLTLGGLALDKWAETSPLFLLLGAALGFTGGLISLIRQVPAVRAGRSKPAARPPKSGSPSP